MIRDISTKQFEEFIRLTTKLRPQELIGLARMLKVETATEELNEKGYHIPREFEDIYSDMLDTFTKCGRRMRREIINLLEECNKDDSEYRETEESIPT